MGQQQWQQTKRKLQLVYQHNTAPTVSRVILIEKRILTFLVFQSWSLHDGSLCTILFSFCLIHCQLFIKTPFNKY